MRTAEFRTKADEAYHRLRRMVETRELDPDDRLTELGAAEMLGVGRASVREAMHRLEAEGLLRGRRARQGRSVQYLEDADPRQVLLRYEMREAIEAQAARLAARNMNRQQIDNLLDLANDTVTFIDMADADGRNKSKMAFLDYMIANCGNPLMYQAWRQHRLFPYTVRDPELEKQILSRQGAPDKHNSPLELAQAIAERDEDKAEDLARQSVRQVTDALRAAFSTTDSEGPTAATGVGATSDQRDG